MLVTTHTQTLGDLLPQTIAVEVHQQSGLPAIHLIGLPEMTVKESRDRVRSAIVQSGFNMPSRRFTINLAPADLPKMGTHYELAIAVGLLLVSGQLVAKTESIELFGELSLSGELRASKGILPALMQQTDKTLIIPKANEIDAQGFNNQHIRLANSLIDVVQFLRGDVDLPRPQQAVVKPTKVTVEWSSVRGQEVARRAMVIAACGGHNLLMFGPPGCGKTLLAQALPGILPPLNADKAKQVALNHSISTIDEQPYSLLQAQAPFRQPHHTTSAVALIGGGSWPKPGEISLAHHGVLFLDELPEFRRDVLEALRQPLETGAVMIARANRKVRFPAQCQLIAAMNPCPCGHLGESKCQCSEDSIKRYRGKVSGPLLDRIDMHVELHPVKVQQLTQLPQNQSSSATIRQFVQKIQNLQYRRQGKLNAHLNIQELEQQASLGQVQQSLIEQIIGTLNLSARSYHRILRLTRTLADSAERQQIHNTDIQQAVSYRMLDRQ